MGVGGLTFHFAGRVGSAVAVTPVVTVTAVAIATIIFAITHILHLAVAIDGAPGSVAITAVVIAVATFIFARGSTTLATRRRAATPRGANTTVRTISAVGSVATVTATLRTLTTGTVTTGVESP